MGKRKIVLQIHFTMTWLLTGLLLAGCFLNALPSLEGFTVCAEERSFEIDDDRSDVRELDFTPHIQIDERSTSQAWHDVQVFLCTQASQVASGANFGRGPPRC